MRASVRDGALVALVCLAVVGLGCSSPAPEPAADHGAHGAAGAAPERTTLLGNLGSYHRTITTTSDEAQRFFDEGLTLLYGFNHEESYRSFARAAALDENAPMPHWGMALALGTNYNDTATPDRLGQAHAHLVAAQQRAANGSEVERAFIDALALRYVATPDDGQQAAREEAYARAMGEVSSRFPDDLDAATLHAESLMNLRPWRLYTPDGQPAPGTDVIVATLERVLKASPAHPGANHYYIHATEASKTPERALEAAKRLETLVPGAGHLVHMPAHVYIRTGDYVASARSNAEAARVDERYIEATGATGMYPLMYYGHNLQFESAAEMYAGRLARARAAARKTVALVEPLAGDVVMVQPFALQEGLVLVRFGEWDDMLAMPAPPAGRPVQEALYRYLIGAAHAGKGDLASATAAQKAFETAAAGVAPDVMISASNTAVSVLDVARKDLAARIADARGDRAQAVRAWEEARAAEDALAYNEPPDWLLPTREGLGHALLAAKRPADAETVFREDLERNRRNPRSLHGLWKSLEARGQAAAAAAARAEFEAAWKVADVGIGR
ncbi:MAG: hypothetical protein AB1635_07085 [Acidobacteriota bacterium]